ncbi:MAG: hypothetical protein KAG94_01835 [Clostridiales bacterium]|nr:hypothetical protein [Clostridiales bacterium]
MKKLLIILLVILIIMSLSLATVLAGGAKVNNPGTAPMPATSQGNNPAPKPETQQATMNKFVANKLEASELKGQTGAMLQQQLLLAKESKLALHTMSEAYKNMSEEQRTENREEITELVQQIKATHKYNLQVRVATQLKARFLLQECILDEAPTEDEVEEATEVLDEL